MPRTFTQLYYHWVFATRQRLPYLGPELTRELYPLFGALVRDAGGSLLAVGGMPDHVHLLVSLRAHPSVATLVKTVKGASSRWINESGCCSELFSWQEGYAAFSVSPSLLPKAKAYILNQAEHHRTRTFEMELDQLLTKHGLSESPAPRPARDV